MSVYGLVSAHARPNGSWDASKRSLLTVIRIVPVLAAVTVTTSYGLSHENEPTALPFGWRTTRSRSARSVSAFPVFDVPDGWLLHASATRTVWPFTTGTLRVIGWSSKIEPIVQPPHAPRLRTRFDHSADADPTPSWSRLKPPPGIGVRRRAPAMRIARVASGKVASEGERA